MTQDQVSADLSNHMHKQDEADRIYDSVQTILKELELEIKKEARKLAKKLITEQTLLYECNESMRICEVVADCMNTINSSDNKDLTETAKKVYYKMCALHADLLNYFLADAHMKITDKYEQKIMSGLRSKEQQEDHEA